MIFIRKIQIILTDIHENLQMISSLSPIFSDFLRFSLKFSDFLRFSSYLCTRKSATRKKRWRCYNLYKVLKNDEALPSEIDSRAFFSLGTSDGIAGNGEPKSVKALFTFLPLSDYPSSKSTI